MGKEAREMLFDHWDLVLTGERIRLTPFTEADQEPYGILALGEEPTGISWNRLRRWGNRLLC